MTLNENGQVGFDKVSLNLEEALAEVRELRAALLFSNNELLQYSHVANHDLQEPLRKIQVYLGILRDRNVLPDPDQAILDRILVSSGRMSMLIADILAHAKVVASDRMVRPVDLNIVVQKIIDDFELAVLERGATVVADKLPTINASALEMNQLFYNLIDNALKFSDPLRAAEITIRCKALTAAAAGEYIAVPKPDRKYYDISVRDNGIGLNVKYAEQIFNAFKRLHPKDLYPGSGIGLTICRTILASHGGTLFVESNPGEGSVFHIIIPE